jgi:hypothetical protein
MRSGFEQLILVAAIAVALGTETRSQNTAPRPIPRTANGRIILGALPGETGVWVPPNAGDERLVDLDPDTAPPADPFAIETNPLLRTPRFNNGVPTATESFSGKITVGRLPFQPWASALYSERSRSFNEPHTRCKASGGPRQFLTPYGVEILDLPDQQRILVVDIGGPHSMRVIYTDGRPHPANLPPTGFGHSIGRWDGDSLVVDSVGFNEGFWMDRQGLPHTEKLHLTERFTRTDFNTLQYQLTVDDPGAYTAPWTTGLLLRWNSNQDLFEYVCQDNNLAPNLMIGDGARSPIVP